MSGEGKVLLTGATGFVGRHLLARLEGDRRQVVCTSRRPKLARAGLRGHEVRRLDVHDPTTMRPALEGCSAAYYLIHGLREEDGYEDREAAAAEAFARAAADAGLERIIYLGGMKPKGEPSQHLRSRLETGKILRAGDVPTVELRATMVIGGGSESWRIVRDLAARLPVMVFPRWLESRTQPVAIADVTAALLGALTLELETSRVFDLPGPEALSGAEIIKRTARLLGANPRTFQVPIVTPRLSTYWLRLVTRADHRVASRLVEGLARDILSTEPPLWDQLDDFELTRFDVAAAQALADEADGIPSWIRRTEQLFRRVTRPEAP